MSSSESGCRRLISSFMPRDSSWKTAVVSTFLSMSKVLHVIQRDRGDVQRPLAFAGAHRIDHLQRPVDDGQRAQAQEVELDQPGFLDVVLVVLDDQAAAVLIAQQRREIGELGGRDHHPPCVLTGTRAWCPRVSAAISQISSASSSLSRNSLSAGSCSMALASVMPTSNGISLESLSPSE